MKILLLLVASSLLGIISVIVYHSLIVKPTNLDQATSAIVSFSPQDPPLQSLKGKVSSFSGLVKWQSRVATEAAQVNSLSLVQQGEQIETDHNGKLNVEFPNIWLMHILPNSVVDFAQTLPVNLVVVQTKGEVDYQKLGTNFLSVRALHLLIEQNSGEMNVLINKDTPVVVINVKAGSARVAFNNVDNISQQITIKQGQQLIFNDTTRKIILQ